MIGYDQHAIAAILKARFHQLVRQWAFFEELRLSTGHLYGSEQRLDAYALALWRRSGVLEKVTYEIKVSRSDWHKERRAPAKRRMGLMVSNYFYFAAPAGIIKPDEVPLECGLIEIAEGGRADKTVAAPFRDCIGPTWSFVASLARRTAAKELAEGSNP